MEPPPTAQLLWQPIPVSETMMAVPVQSVVLYSSAQTGSVGSAVMQVGWGARAYARVTKATMTSGFMYIIKSIVDVDSFERF